MKIGVNIDHIATLRQQRREGDPDLDTAAKVVMEAGADSITIHLREDRRHIQDDDVFRLRKLVPILNLELSTSPEILDIACEVKPNFCCLVPEKREELTTEGGLDLTRHQETIERRFGVQKIRWSFPLVVFHKPVQLWYP